MCVAAFRVHGLERIAQAHGADVANKLLSELARQIGEHVAEADAGGMLLRHANAASGVSHVRGWSHPAGPQPRAGRNLPELIGSVLARVSGQPTNLGTEYLPAVSAGLALVDGNTTDGRTVVDQRAGGLRAGA